MYLKQNQLKLMAKRFTRKGKKLTKKMRSPNGTADGSLVLIEYYRELSLKKLYIRVLS